MKKIKGIIALVVLLAFASSCQEEYEPVMFPAHQLSGEWYVTYTIGGVDVYNWGHTTIMTYNTANDEDSIWVTDNDHFWGYRAVVGANPEGMAFGQSDSLDNQAYPVKMVVKSGQIFPDGGKSKTGVVTDSISFVVGFGDDAPGTEYVVSGHRRTGFVEDDY